MKSIIKWALLGALLGTTSSFAGTCHDIIDQNLIFYDKYPNANLTLMMWSQQIIYKNISATIQVNCISNDKTSITWNSSELKGFIIGTAARSSIGRDTYIIEVHDGEINGKKFPFKYLTTHIIGSGGH